MNKKTPLPLLGRRDEIASLDRAARSQQAELMTVYGRRRIGKTYLIRTYFSTSEYHFLEVIGQRDSNLKTQLANFAGVVERFFSIDSTKPVYKNWTEAFHSLAILIDRMAEKQKTWKKWILFFDEVPWLSAPKQGFLEAFEYFWNSWASKRKDCKVILCGSAASWMIQKIVKNRGGLHNRITHRLRLLPFTLKETQEYLKFKGIDYSLKDICTVYMCLGGVPFYLNQLQKGMSVAQNMNRMAFAKEGFLRDEFNNLYQALFNHADLHENVIKTLVKHPHGLNRSQLLERAGMSSGGGAKEVISNLEESGFIQSFVPMKKNKYGSIYRIADEYSNFYLKWIQPTLLAHGGAKTSWQSIHQTQGFKSWAGIAFEKLCLKHVDCIKEKLGIAGVETNVSSMVGANYQIDLLLDRADQVITICEAKFYDATFTIDKSYAQKLRERISLFREDIKTRKSIFLCFITPYGINENTYSQELVGHVVTAEDFF